LCKRRQKQVRKCYCDTRENEQKGSSGSRSPASIPNSKVVRFPEVGKKGTFICFGGVRRRTSSCSSYERKVQGGTYLPTYRNLRVAVVFLKTKERIREGKTKINQRCRIRLRTPEQRVCSAEPDRAGFYTRYKETRITAGASNSTSTYHEFDELLVPLLPRDVPWILRRPLESDIL